MKEHEPVSVARVEAFQFVFVSEELNAPVRQDAVAIHQQQLDARRAALYLGKLIHNPLLYRTSKNCMSASFHEPPARVNTKTAVPDCSCPSSLTLSVTSTATRLASSCSVRTTVVCHISGWLLTMPLTKETSSPGTICASMSAFLPLLIT